MAFYLGIDLGTTGLKTIVIDPAGHIRGRAYKAYPIETPEPRYAQQDTEAWWRALKETTTAAIRTSGASPADIAGIGLSGQMHGSVFLDREKKPLFPAIVWCDQRSREDLARLHALVSQEELRAWVQNPVTTGFQVCSILWLRRVHPKLFQRVRHVLLPKDYLRFRLTGEIGSEASDACGTLLFDCRSHTWSRALLERLDIDAALLPDAGHISCDLCGVLTAQAAAELGLNPGTAVAFGGGDQPMQAVGNGVLRPGDALVTLGTGGQVFVPMSTPRCDTGLRVHTFCHAPADTWYSMGAILNCCLAQNWFFDKVLGCHDYAGLHAQAARVPPGSDGLFFLPYLTGERTPYMNPDARGIFWGMTLSHDRAAMVRAVIEGVGFALMDAMEATAAHCPPPDRLILSGGGSRSAVWKQILSDMFNRPICTSNMKEEACVGAALCAMVACGAYPSLAEACGAIVRLDESATAPIEANHAIYQERLALFRGIYAANAPLFQLGDKGRGAGAPQ